jgi:hypothetical protein
MNIIKFDEVKKYNLDETIIKDLISLKEKLIIDSKKFYFSFSLPIIDYYNNKVIKGDNTLYEYGLDYSDLLNVSINNMYIYKTIFYLEKEKYIIVDDVDNLSFINKENRIINLFIDIIDKCEKDYRYINSILYEVKKHVTWIQFFDSYKIIEYLDKLLYYVLSYQNIINDMIMIVSRIAIIIDYDKDNEEYELFKNRIKIFKNNIIDLNNNLEQTRHGTMQRISYLDSGTTRILTIVAAMFLPTAFLVSLLSMPYDGIPFKNKKNGYFVILSILIVIFILLGYLFIDDFKNLFRKQ